MNQTNKRAIRSFVRREGKITSGQRKAIEKLWSAYGVNLAEGQINFAQLYGRTADTVLEIGFGNGLSLAEMAEQDSECNYFGIEVHRPGIGSLLVQVKQRDLHNVRVSGDDAVEVINRQIPDTSLYRIQIFFPDPWHKKRHHKRRLVQPEFVQQLTDKLIPDGILHIATDWQNYAEHILHTLSDNQQLKNTTTDFAIRPDYRPTTKYEKRGNQLGHGVWEIVFRKI